MLDDAVGKGVVAECNSGGAASNVVLDADVEGKYDVDA